MLEAKPDLAVRDVMEAIVQTAATIDGGPGWQNNQAGINHSYEYGHGLIDAYEAVSFATGQNGYPAWESLLGERMIEVPVNPNGYVVGPDDEKTFSVTPTANMRLEHVELAINISTTGDEGIGPLEIEIERIWQLQGGMFGGLHKTVSVFAEARNDTAANYENPDPNSDGDALFTSVRHWGETGTATWNVRLRNTSTSKDPVTATWNTAVLRFYGTPKCIADWDMDSDVDTDDDIAYNTDYNTPNSITADLDGDRDVDQDDLDLWDFVYYPAGCS